METYVVRVEIGLLVDVEVEAESRDEALDTVFDSEGWENVDLYEALYEMDRKAVEAFPAEGM